MSDQTYKVWVAGGRKYNNGDLMHDVLADTASSCLNDELMPVLITGAARGADLLAEKIWREFIQRPYVGVPAPWHRLGKGAGMNRNKAIGIGAALYMDPAVHPDELVVFPGGRGTRDAVRIAETMGIPIRRIGGDDE